MLKPLEEEISLGATKFWIADTDGERVARRLELHSKKGHFWISLSQSWRD